MLTAQNPHAPINPFPIQTNVPNEPTPLLFHATSALKDAATESGAKSGWVRDDVASGEIAVPSGVYGTHQRRQGGWGNTDSHDGACCKCQEQNPKLVRKKAFEWCERHFRIG